MIKNKDTWTGTSITAIFYVSHTRLRVFLQTSTETLSCYFPKHISCRMWFWSTKIHPEVSKRLQFKNHRAVLYFKGFACSLKIKQGIRSVYCTSSSLRSEEWCLHSLCCTLLNTHVTIQELERQRSENPPTSREVFYNDLWKGWWNMSTRRAACVMSPGLSGTTRDKNADSYQLYHNFRFAFVTATKSPTNLQANGNMTVEKGKGGFPLSSFIICILPVPKVQQWTAWTKTKELDPGKLTSWKGSSYSWWAKAKQTQGPTVILCKRWENNPVSLSFCWRKPECKHENQKQHDYSVWAQGWTKSNLQRELSLIPMGGHGPNPANLPYDQNLAVRNAKLPS